MFWGFVEKISKIINGKKSKYWSASYQMKLLAKPFARIWLKRRVRVGFGKKKKQKYIFTYC